MGVWLGKQSKRHGIKEPEDEVNVLEKCNKVKEIKSKVWFSV